MKLFALPKFVRQNLYLLVLCAGALGMGLVGCKSHPEHPTPIPGIAPEAPAEWRSGKIGLRPGTAPSYGLHPSPLTAGLRQEAAVAAPLSTPGSEELWVIARRTEQQQPQNQEEMPGSGSLVIQQDQKTVALPLKHTDVKAVVQGYIATVDVTQQFQNPYDKKIEAVYVFPLPENAAVNEFIMTIGERRIRGIIRERQQAEQIYQEAKRQGYVASLLTQERPNIFTQSVANIEPGKQIDVVIRYFNTLAYVDGWYEFVFPMVVGPRFNPPGSTQGVGAVARGATGLSGQKTEVQYLRPDERSGHDIDLELSVQAGVAIEEFVCKTHQIQSQGPNPGTLKVKLGDADKIPNRDFVLRYRVAGERIKTTFMAQQDNRGGFLSVMLYPPKDLRALNRYPLELVFVLDCSGSMHGQPLAQAKAAVARGLKNLRPGDSFQLINFSTKASQLGPAPLEATSENVDRGLRYLQSLNSDGGTMMIEGIKAALDFPHDPRRLRFVCFMTDGYIGNEIQIFRETHQRLKDSRIFSFGVGSGVNRYLLDNLARMGQGAVAYLGLKDDADAIMDAFFERISHPAMTDVKIDWGDMAVTDVFPRRLPDLFVGRPLIVTGRFKDSGTNIKISGIAGGHRIEMVIPVDIQQPENAHAGLPAVWARRKIADIAEQSIWDPNPEWPQQIKSVALDFSLMSDFTAFVAVDSTARTQGESGVTVPVPVPVPEGVEYKTTVQEK